MLKVKVCGITNRDDALAAEHYGAAALGFIFSKNSKRFIAPETAISIIDRISPFTLKVGVFVNEEPAVINEISKRLKLNIVQLHGDETDEMISGVNYPVIKAFRVSNSFRFEQLNTTAADYILLDSYSPNDFGGTGEIFNWELIPDKLRNKIILAGGVSVKNISNLITNINPAAIDLSSSLEISPGKKDHTLIKEFFHKLNELRRS